MKTKTFQIRLRSKFTRKDEKKVNTFLERVNVITVYTNLAQEEKPYYAYSINYEEIDDKDCE